MNLRFTSPLFPCAKTSDGRRPAPKISSFAAGTLQAVRTGGRCRLAEQEACGLVDLSGLYVTPAAAARDAGRLAVGLSLRPSGQAEPAPGAVPGAQSPRPRKSGRRRRDHI